MTEALRQTAMAAARLAGQEALRRWRGPHETKHKGLRDIVTEADLAAERAAVDLILSNYPNHAILAEEHGNYAAESATSEFVWIIDPIDGTTNYARGLPVFSVSVAVSQGGRPVAGALFDPLRDEMYHARQGAGAFCNDRRLSCSSRSELIDFLIGVDWPRDETLRGRLFQAIAACSPQVGGWRSLGSAALGIASVAAGVLDAYVHPTLWPWDMAAAGLIVEEAGGRVTGLDGSARWWEGTTCLASNGLCHDALLGLFQHIVGSGTVA